MSETTTRKPRQRTTFRIVREHHYDEAACLAALRLLLETARARRAREAAARSEEGRS